MADIGGPLVVTGHPVTDRRGPLVVIEDYLTDTADPLADIRGPLTEMGGPVTGRHRPFRQHKRPRVSRGPLADTGGKFSLECLSKRTSCLDCVVLKPPTIGDRMCPVLKIVNPYA